jgi:hypothetical protein
MNAVVSSRTPEGVPGRCPVCRGFVCVETSWPTGDATCPHCGVLVVPDGAAEALEDSLATLRGWPLFVAARARRRTPSLRHARPVGRVLLRAAAAAVRGGLRRVVRVGAADEGGPAYGNVSDPWVDGY